MAEEESGLEEGRAGYGRGILAVVFSVFAIYALGFACIRLRWVELTVANTTVASYYSEGLTKASDGGLGKAVDLYRPAFVLEARLRGSRVVMINGWGMGMRNWSSLF